LSTLRWRSALGFVALYSAGALVSEPAFKVPAAITAVAIAWSCHRGGLHSWLSARPVQFLGKVSYSLYLTHSVVFTSCAFAVSALIGEGLGAQIVFLVAALAGSVAMAWMMWALVEQPAARWARRLPLGRPYGRRPRSSGVSEHMASLVDR
jgi:peptidoglycan/LPS O-acetylase OafA/YrhL